MADEEGARKEARSWAASPIWMILFILAALFLLANTLLGRPLNKLGSGVKTTETRLKDYTGSSEDGFSLKYPENWRSLSREELAKFQGAVAFAVQKARPNALFGIKVQAVKAKDVSLKDVAKSLNEAMPKNFTGFKKLDQKIISVNGRKALKYSYVFMAEPKISVREQLVIIPGPTKVFHLTAWTQARNFDKVKDDFERITDSFIVR